MTGSIDIWKLLAGVAIFMIGMGYMEQSLQQLAGRPFKLFLRRQTSHTLKAVLGGTVVTALLQSSSVVNLMVLAFVGAGVITTRNALAIMLGSNLGTTVSSWVILLLGFRFNVDLVALPLTAVAGIAMVLSPPDSRLAYWSRFLTGLGFLFVGLGLMKTGMEQLGLSSDLMHFRHYPAVFFFLLGLVITALIQSSSAMVALTLSAVNLDAVSLYSATAIILGSEIGTVLKLPLASMKGTAVKKRTAYGNLLFNSVTVLLILLFLGPINRLITGWLGITEPTLALVFFQSLTNLICILLFYPSLDLLARFLDRRFRQASTITRYIHQVSPEQTDWGSEALRMETGHFFRCAIGFCLDCFGQRGSHAPPDFLERPTAEQYGYLKALYGQIHEYAINLQRLAAKKVPLEKISQLISSARNGMYAAKSIQDARKDLEQLRNSSNDIKYNFYLQTARIIQEFYGRLDNMLGPAAGPGSEQALLATYQAVTVRYTDMLRELYQEPVALRVNETDITTLLNFNREVFTSFKAMLFGLKDYLLDEKQAAYFEELPGFIH
ncbi:MAG TPA: Na/Pi symporter [Chitinophagaceae bacterium]|nr:Na/Pi symporter [Chitinophagaceae bacterium]